MMRSITQAILVLIFMLAASWRLTTITFVLIPLVMGISSVRSFTLVCSGAMLHITFLKLANVLIR